jgi:cell division septal protein FtsQ
MKLYEVKKGADIKNLKEEIRGKLWRIAMLCKLHNGINYVMTITSGNDGIHMEGSKHYSNEAIDMRIRDMTNRHRTFREIQRDLGKDYDVILKETHIHIEYDPK